MTSRLDSKRAQHHGLFCRSSVAAMVICASVPAWAQQQTSRTTTAAAGDDGAILVTAQKREERLQDVPVPVTVVKAADLATESKPRIRDYFEQIPGFNISPAPSSGNQQALTIRGISSGAFGIPTVGVTVDDVPFGGFTREFTPDFDPSDLERVEVLRGPQGTLYGASSLGGLLKFVTVDPSTSRFFGQVEAGMNGVSHGSEPGYSFRGSVNVPVNSDIAIRASGYTRQDAGYIDNPVLGTKGVNEAHSSGGHVSALWHMPAAFSLKLSALYQNSKGDGLSDVTVQPGIGNLQQNYIAGVGPSDTKAQAYSAVLHGKLAGIDLTSLTGYNVYKLRSNNDYTYAVGASALKLLGVDGASIENSGKTRKFSEELRADIKIGKRIDWLVGGFYTHELVDYKQVVPARSPLTGTIVGSPLESIDNGTIRHQEYAIFSDLTFQITDRFDIQFGGRESFLRDYYAPTHIAGLLIPAGQTQGALSPHADVFTYLVTPRYRISNNLMVYSRLSSGYRPGRANANNPDPAVPRASKPDRTRDYEVGTKGSAFDHFLDFDFSAYYIKWSNIQIGLTDQTNKITYFTNGSGAKSEGVEVSGQIHPWRGSSFGGWVVYSNAVLTKNFPNNTGAYGVSGNRLPYGSRWSGNLSLKQKWALTPDLKATAGADLSFVGYRYGLFSTTALRAAYPSYRKLDLHVTIDWNSWSATIYANNVTNKEGLLGGGIGDSPSYSYIVTQPRTIGLSAAKKF